MPDDALYTMRLPPDGQITQVPAKLVAAYQKMGGVLLTPDGVDPGQAFQGPMESYQRQAPPQVPMQGRFPSNAGFMPMAMSTMRPRR